MKRRRGFQDQIPESDYKEGPQGLKFVDMTPGKGAQPKKGDRIAVHYEIRWHGITFMTSRQGMGVTGGEPLGFNLGASGPGGTLPGLDLVRFRAKKGTSFSIFDQVLYSLCEQECLQHHVIQPLSTSLAWCVVHEVCIIQGPTSRPKFCKSLQATAHHIGQSASWVYLCCACMDPASLTLAGRDSVLHCRPSKRGMA